jgi:DNA invertase Pin-like site-specific DNA recombinase
MKRNEEDVVTKYVVLYRVSTSGQSRSGLGLEGQQESVRRFLRPDDKVVGSFTEVESGRSQERPQLAAAMAACRVLGARLLIAKLDRLARDVAFIAAMMKSDIKFTAVDMPDADPFRLHIEAAISEEEARKISARTKTALAAARERGMRLGGYRGRSPTEAERAAGLAVRQQAARARAAGLRAILDEIKGSGAGTLAAIADALNQRLIPAPRGGAWGAAQVRRVLAIAA